MTIEGILKELEFNYGTFPRQALQEAIANKEQITPGLLSVLEGAKQNAWDLLRQKRYIAHIYAMYLLAQFREKRAYPLIVDFFSIPGETTLDLTGDVVTEDLNRILASVSGGDTTLIKSLIENDSANEYVRDAALDSLLVLVARGEKSREEIMGYYQSLFRGGLDREPALVWSGLVSSCCDLYAEEVMEDIRQAYRDGLVDELYIDLEYVEGALARGKETVLAELREHRRYGYVDDTIGEMESWACFQRPIQPEMPERKIGRNEPCPCGSGKKYKRCCMRRQQ